MIRFLPKFRTVHHLMVLLTLLFVLSFIYHERIMPYRAAYNCRWPEVVNTVEDNAPAFKSDQDQDTVPTNELTRVLLVTDPQLIDGHTYPGRNPLLLKLSQHTVDTYLKNNYKYLINQLQPEYIFFLGDYLDNGRSSSNKYFKHEWARFQRVFNFKEFQTNYKQNENLFINLPGNHDIGFGDKVKLPSRDRFTKHFGEPNLIKSINKVDFIMLDTISLSSSLEEINLQARTFLDTNFGESIVKLNPRILLSHVPLYRDVQTQTCGSLRENHVFHTNAGYQYQLALNPELSLELLSKIKPELIFTGDDHDYCDISHTEVERPDQKHTIAREITVKSISMAMGIKYPAVQLLSFKNTEASSFKYNTQICYLPTPYVNIANYIVLSVISALLLLWWNAKQRSSRYNYSILPSSVPSTAILSTDITTVDDATHTPSPIGAVPTSQKVSKFLKEQDEGSSTFHITTLPKYTFTSNFNSKSSIVTNSKVFKGLKCYKEKVMAFMRKWNLVSFFKHCVFLGSFIIFVYYVGFVLTV